MLPFLLLLLLLVIPARAGIQRLLLGNLRCIDEVTAKALDSRFRGNDGLEVSGT